MARLQQQYREKIAPELMTKFGYKSVMEVPRITKITLNMGVSEAVADKKVMDSAVGDLTKIAGQKPVVTKAKSQSLVSKSAKAKPLVAWSHCVACKCMNSSIASSPWLCPVCATSVVSLVALSTAVVTTTSV